MTLYLYLLLKLRSFYLDNLLSIRYYKQGVIEMMLANSALLPSVIFPNPCRMHTYEKSARNSFRMHTYGAKGLKSPGMNTYKKEGGGGGTRWYPRPTDPLKNQSAYESE